MLAVRVARCPMRGVDLFRSVEKLAVLVLIAVMCVIGPAAYYGEARAQGSSAAQKVAEEALRKGLDAQKARRHAQAISHFSQAINAGGLQRKQLTYALYRRGISHRAQKKPAQALSDINSALFFKGDLSSEDRAGALAERDRAYKDAGLKPTTVATASAAPAASGGNASPTAASLSRKAAKTPEAVVPRRTATTFSPTTPILGGSNAPVRTKPTAPPASSVAPTAFQTRVEVARPTKPAATRRQPNDAKTSSSWQVATVPGKTERSAGAGSTARTQGGSGAVATTSGWRTSEVPAPQERAPAANGVTQFFSNLFGGQSTGGVSPPIVTGALASDGRKVDASRTSQTSRPSKTPPVSTPVTQTASTNGRFEIQVASLRNKERATALAKQLMVQYPNGYFSDEKSSRVIESARRNGGGQIYAVRYGAFDTKADLASMCDKLVADGLDCLVVTKQ